MRRAKYPKGAGEMLLALGSLRAGKISFNEFERRTRRDWDRIARELHGRWPLPPSVSVEDVRQELLLAVVVRKASSQGRNLLEKWQPSRRTSLDEYVVWNARVMAARWIHKQRGATRNSEEGDVAGKIKSKFFPVISTLRKESDRSDSFLEVAVPGEQESILIAGENLISELGTASQSCSTLETARRELAAEIRRKGLTQAARDALRAELRAVTRKLRVPTRRAELVMEMLAASGRVAEMVAVAGSAQPVEAGMVTGREALRAN